MHFFDTSTMDTYTGPPELFKIRPILEIIHQNFQPAYLPSENISVDKSLTLWKGHLEIRQSIPSEGSQVWNKDF